MNDESHEKTQARLEAARQVQLEFETNKHAAFVGAWPNPEHNIKHCKCRYGTCDQCLKRLGAIK